jgi:hypothetical protein
MIYPLKKGEAFLALSFHCRERENLRTKAVFEKLFLKVLCFSSYQAQT